MAISAGLAGCLALILWLAITTKNHGLGQIRWCHPADKEKFTKWWPAGV